MLHWFQGKVISGMSDAFLDFLIRYTVNCSLKRLGWEGKVRWGRLCHSSLWMWMSNVENVLICGRKSKYFVVRFTNASHLKINHSLVIVCQLWLWLLTRHNRQNTKSDSLSRHSFYSPIALVRSQHYKCTVGYFCLGCDDFERNLSFIEWGEFRRGAKLLSIRVISSRCDFTFFWISVSHRCDIVIFRCKFAPFHFISFSLNDSPHRNSTLLVRPSTWVQMSSA